VLREYQNLSYEEIAAVTGSSLSAVKSRLFKARRRLAELMEASIQASNQNVKTAVERAPENERVSKQIFSQN